MYDVLYIDDAKRCRIVASRLERDAAADLARNEARRRHASRMFLAGSARAPQSRAVLVIRSGP